MIDQGDGLGNMSQLRVAIIGCGAVAERYHLPVLAGHEGVRLVALVDRDVQRVKPLADAYKIATVLTDAADLTTDMIDAAVIATPPGHHAACTKMLLERGIHVLVEKPMATTLADAESMVATADRTGMVLSVGVFRRLLPSLRMLKAAIDAEMLGKPLGFDLEGGAVYGWEAATLGNMLKSHSGGGVLMDMGPHFFDQLLYLFDGPGEVLAYEDNALGGIESDCVARLRLSHRGRPVDGRVELSRTRNLPNELRVICERGELAIPPADRYRVIVRQNGLQFRDPRSGEVAPHQLELKWAEEPETPWYETFRAEIDDWVDAIAARRQPVLSGRSALASARLIDACYRDASPLSEPWTSHPMCDAAETSPTRIEAVRAFRRVLVTGATGFIGCRVAEILSRRSGYAVRAVVHNPGNASRIARLPVELVQADLTRREDLSRLVEGVDSIVHCAIGTESWDRSSVFRVTVDGTRGLLDAARAAGVGRFVHLSTIAVHADDYRGVIDENAPLAPTRGGTYGESKLAAEQAVLKSGLPCMVFRPGCVYGPFGKTFITRPIEYLMRGRLVLAGAAATRSNTVYVDNLVEAIIRSLEAGEEAVGRIFSLADDDGMTWGDFYDYFAHRAGATVRRTDGPSAGERKAAKAGWFGAVGTLAASDEIKAFASKALWTDPIGTTPRWLLSRSPALKKSLKRMLRMQSAAVYVRPAPGGSGDILEITPRLAEVRSDLARRVLGWQPLLDRAACLDRTYEWLQAARIVPSKSEEAVS